MGEALGVVVLQGSAAPGVKTSLGAGGAEFNFAVAIARLGFKVEWIGLLGDDLVGDLIRSVARDEGVSLDHACTVSGGQTGLYVRELHRSGDRRLAYYRGESVARKFEPTLWPLDWKTVPGWLHVTGITAALGDGPRALLFRAIDWANSVGVPVSFDPNYRSALWAPDEARPHLRRLSERADHLLMSEDDAELLTGTAEPEDVLEAFTMPKLRAVVLKRGEKGILARVGGNIRCLSASPTQKVVDTVGAGDAFDAGYVAVLVTGGTSEDALRMGLHLGARATEGIDDQCYPRRADLPQALRSLIGGLT